MIGSGKIRHQLFRPAELARRFEALAALPGASKSSILAPALAAFFARVAPQLACGGRTVDTGDACGADA